MSAAFDVVIVGGGAAGIAAARRLADTGLATLLLEAESRLGGRAWTQEVAGLRLDLGAGWLHSAERNAWTEIARADGVPLFQGTPAWGSQFHDLGFSAEERLQARTALGDWMQRMSEAPPPGDNAAASLDPASEWNPFVRTIAGFLSGGRLEDLSAVDYLAYDQASSELNWRLPSGFGALIAGSFPARVALRLATPVEGVELEARGVRLTTPRGVVHARALIFGVSTQVLAGDSIKLPAQLAPWREAAARLPLGHVEKLFLEIVGDSPFEPETQVLGDPRDPRTGSYYLRPMDMPVVEGFFGNEGALFLEDAGPAAGFAFALDQLAALFGADIRRSLRPMLVSRWNRSLRIGGAYSYARPGQAAARQALAQPFDARIFFAGEATSREDFSTAHGAHDSGVRAAEQAIAALLPGRKGASE